ncbi:hypothetical protein SO802_015691 [Lithocarpus litseifolius]|uniref:C2H2-type domain-containing protein n=1 Tax=Lithocarpus litseifolius TaxID=425828 RepID=A0AAW2CXP4_9ROSI
MAKRWELGFPKSNASSLKEQVARTILRNVRAQGHPYVEIREDGKKFIFFCTLCLAPCYSDTVLFDHLKGNLHTERLSTAKVTLMGPNPWPFNDGVLFFDNSVENDKNLGVSNTSKSRLLEWHNDDNNLSIVNYDGNSKSSGNGYVVDHSDTEISSDDLTLNANGENGSLVIPGVRIGHEISDIKGQEVGFGLIGARFCEKDDVSIGINRIWCEWLGKKSPGGNNDKFKVPEHDFAVITFNYNLDMGHKELFDNVKSLPSPSPTTKSEIGNGTCRKRKAAFSDPEDVSESFNNQYDLSVEDTSASNDSSSRLILTHFDDQLLHMRFISNKSIRRELRRQQRVAAERMCDICQQRMLPGKDVSALMNMKTGRLACSSRNVNGAFHVFHTSCVVHWILFCEFQIITKELHNKRNAAKYDEIGKDGEAKATRTQDDSVFCPECEGTGIITEGNELETPNIHPSEMFKCKIKASDGRRAWMKNPEVLENCSTGFHFPCQSEETNQEKAKPLKLLRFYGCDV